MAQEYRDPTAPKAVANAAPITEAPARAQNPTESATNTADTTSIAGVPAKPKRARRTKAQIEAEAAAKAKAKKKAAAKKAAAKKSASTTTKKPRIKKDAPFVVPPPAPGAAPAARPAKKYKSDELVFALDIGTRSVIGIVAAEENGALTILDTARQEHKTRAMLDGQIHDVPQVAAIIRDVRDKLEKAAGPLHRVAVAAAGRALYTMTAEAEMEFGDIITSEQERHLDFAGVQAAQAKLAASDTIDDPTRYYCVGYSTVRYTLDGNQLKTLVGQRGRRATAEVIATFLPRQVIDSMDSALKAVDLDMQAITLEPIAAINVLIPPTMRHLNLVLVDIGAGTSDVAITKNGSVIAYGMVPLAGDEITEAISQHFLLDFNVAERIKREAANGADVSFEDILGIHYDLPADEILAAIAPNVQKLANAIAHQIMELNGGEPQAVLLVGGGALTPGLAKAVGDILKLPGGRVAVRRPETVEGVLDLPDELRLPDAVTPLGILRIASLNTLHFLSVYVNDEEYRLFNFRALNISDALLAAGIQLKKYNGKTGLGVQITVNGETQFFPGTMGTLAKLTLDGAETTMDAQIRSGSRIRIEPGADGTAAVLQLADVVNTTADFTIYINGEVTYLAPGYTINDKIATPDQRLRDGDVIAAKPSRTVGETLAAAGLSPTGRKIPFTLNGIASQYAAKPDIIVNDEPSTLSALVAEGDRIEYVLNEEPKLGKVLDIKDYDAYMTIVYNGAEQKVPSAALVLKMNGRPATIHTMLADDCTIEYRREERNATLVSEALAAVGFVTPPPSSRVTVEILVNEKAALFSDPIKNGDSLTVKITPTAQTKAENLTANQTAPANEAPKLTESLLSKEFVEQMKQAAADKKAAAVTAEKATSDVASDAALAAMNATIAAKNAATAKESPIQPATGVSGWAKFRTK